MLADKALYKWLLFALLDAKEGASLLIYVCGGFAEQQGDACMILLPHTWSPKVKTKWKITVGILQLQSQ